MYYIIDSRYNRKLLVEWEEAVRVLEWELQVSVPLPVWAVHWRPARARLHHLLQLPGVRHRQGEAGQRDAHLAAGDCHRTNSIRRGRAECVRGALGQRQDVDGGRDQASSQVGAVELSQVISVLSAQTLRGQDPGPELCPLSEGPPQGGPHAGRGEEYLLPQVVRGSLPSQQDHQQSQVL